MGLFSPAWKSRNEEKALACVRATGDQATLERIAREALTSRVRMNAAEKLTEPERINRLAAESPDHYVRSTLAGKVTDQALLQRLAGQDEDFLVRSKSLKKIEDELFLAAYALKINHDELAQIAARGIRSQALLAALAAGCDREVVIRECLDKLGDQPSPEALEALANGKHKLVRGYLRKQRVRAIRGMKDKGELLRAAREETDAGCRVAALETLRDGKLCGPEDRDALYRAATADAAVGCRTVAYGILRRLKKDLDGEWWAANINEATDDQQLSLNLQRSDADPAAAETVADRLIAENSGDEVKYIRARCTMGVVEALEKKLSAGDKAAARVLLALYRSNELNPALSGHAQAQKRRITAQHKDGMVDSTVCGETFTHADYRFNETLLPR